MLPNSEEPSVKISCKAIDKRNQAKKIAWSDSSQQTVVWWNIVVGWFGEGV